MKISTTITTKEAAARLGVHQETVRRWCKKSGFGIRFPGGRYRIPENRIAEIERDLLACGAQR
jgi:excisionase family DNA binding protein